MSAGYNHELLKAARHSWHLVTHHVRTAQLLNHSLHGSGLADAADLLNVPMEVPPAHLALLVGELGEEQEPAKTTGKNIPKIWDGILGAGRFHPKNLGRNPWDKKTPHPSYPGPTLPRRPPPPPTILGPTLQALSIFPQQTTGNLNTTPRDLH